MIGRAIALATEDPPGPVHLDVPISVATMPATTSGRSLPPAPAAPAPSPGLAEARRWLGEARRPVLIAGVDALHHDAEDELRRLVEEFGIPLITTYKAKGVVDERLDLVLGGAGLSPPPTPCCCP